jgi:hypothetical protein
MCIRDSKYKGFSNYPTWLAWYCISEDCEKEQMESFVESSESIKEYIKDHLDMFNKGIRDDFIEWGIGNIDLDEIAERVKEYLEECGDDETDDEDETPRWVNQLKEQDKARYEQEQQQKREKVDYENK